MLSAASSSVAATSGLCSRVYGRVGRFVRRGGFTTMFAVSTNVLPLPSLSQANCRRVVGQASFSLAITGRRKEGYYCVFRRRRCRGFLHVHRVAGRLRSTMGRSFHKFSMYFRPVVSVHRSELAKTRILVHFASGGFTRVSPTRFVPLLRADKLVVPAKH